MPLHGEVELHSATGTKLTTQPTCLTAARLGGRHGVVPAIKHEHHFGREYTCTNWGTGKDRTANQQTGIEPSAGALARVGTCAELRSTWLLEDPQVGVPPSMLN